MSPTAKGTSSAWSGPLAPASLAKHLVCKQHWDCSEHVLGSLGGFWLDSSRKLREHLPKIPYHWCPWGSGAHRHYGFIHLASCFKAAHHQFLEHRQGWTAPSSIEALLLYRHYGEKHKGTPLLPVLNKSKNPCKFWRRTWEKCWDCLIHHTVCYGILIQSKDFAHTNILRGNLQKSILQTQGTLLSVLRRFDSPMKKPWSQPSRNGCAQANPFCRLTEAKGSAGTSDVLVTPPWGAAAATLAH